MFLFNAYGGLLGPRSFFKERIFSRHRLSEVAVHDRKELDLILENDIDDTDLEAGWAVLGVVDKADLSAVKLLRHVEDDSELKAIGRLGEVGDTGNVATMALNLGDIGKTRNLKTANLLLERTEQINVKTGKVLSYADKTDFGTPNALLGIVKTASRAKAVDIGERDVAETADDETDRLITGESRQAAEIDAVHLRGVGIEKIKIDTENIPTVKTPRKLNGRSKTDRNRSKTDYGRLGFFLDILSESRANSRNRESRDTNLEHFVH